MFTRQVHLLDRLRGRVDPLLVDTLRELLGNCSAELEHRGPIVVNYSPPQVDITQTGGSPVATNYALYVRGPVYVEKGVNGALRTGVALADWTVAPDCPKVLVQTVIDNRPVAVWVNLPCPADQDPAVFQGNAVVFSQTPDGAAYAPWYGSAKIGTVKMWSGDPSKLATEQPGWRLCDGGDPVQGDKRPGARPDMRARFVVGYYGPDGLPQTNQMGAQGDYATIGGAQGTGGYAWHGESKFGQQDPENAHPQHPNHRHCFDGTTHSSTGTIGTHNHTLPGGSSTGTAEATDSCLLSSQQFWTSGADALPDGPPVNWTHAGPFNDNMDTDNRPPYYALAFLIRVR